MKIGFYSPYWSTMGGGEKYMLDLARCFPDDEVVFMTNEKDFIEKAKNRFDFYHPKTTIVSNFINDKQKLKKDILKIFDLFFYQCDGSIFFGKSKKNILLIQSPAHCPKFSIINKMKLISWNEIVCNSEFTSDFIKKTLLISPRILNPSIDTMGNNSKQNIILSVGRFFPHLHSKKQEILIDVFRKIERSILDLQGEKWKLVFAGSVADSDRKYLLSIKEKAKDLNIEFQINISKNQIDDLYKNSKIYWHAAGYGEDLKRHPEKAEHFGISTLEAISAGCYPLVFKAGGQIEIIGDNEEFYWETPEDLAIKTKDLIANYSERQREFEKIKNIPEKYSFERFKTKLYEIIK